MKKGWMALAAVLLAVALPLGGALASIAGLDETLSAYLDTDGDVRYSFGLEVGTLLPYGEETLTMMNNVLGHIRVAASETDAGPKARSPSAWTARAWRTSPSAARGRAPR